VGYCSLCYLCLCVVVVFVVLGWFCVCVFLVGGGGFLLWACFGVVLLALFIYFLFWLVGALFVG